MLWLPGGVDARDNSSPFPVCVGVEDDHGDIVADSAESERYQRIRGHAGFGGQRRLVARSLDP